MSSADLITSLPNDWKLIPLKHTCNVSVSNVDKLTFDDEIPVRLCNYTDVYKNERISADAELMKATATPQEIERFHLEVGDIVITKDSESWNDIAIPAYVENTADDFVCGYHLALIRPRKDVLDGRFLLRCMQSRSIALQLELKATGVTRYGLPKDAIALAVLPLPPLESQRIIANYLDRETARIDKLIAEKERMLALLDEKRSALISRVVTRGLDPNAPLKDSGLEWLGEIPAHWQKPQLRFVCSSLQIGPFGTQLHAEEYIDNGIPLINPAHLKGNRISPDFRVSVDELTAERLAVHRLEEGDIVFGRRGELGRCGVVQSDQVGWLCGTGSLRARCNRAKVDPEYVALVFNSTSASMRLSLESVGSTMDNLNTEMLGHFRIPLPPLMEQENIVRAAQSGQHIFSALHANLQTSIKLSIERRTALITAAVTGQIPLEEMAG